MVIEAKMVFSLNGLKLNVKLSENESFSCKFFIWTSKFPGHPYFMILNRSWVNYVLYINPWNYAMEYLAGSTVSWKIRYLDLDVLHRSVNEFVFFHNRFLPGNLITQNSKSEQGLQESPEVWISPAGKFSLSSTCLSIGWSRLYHSSGSFIPNHLHLHLCPRWGEAPSSQAHVAASLWCIQCMTPIEILLTESLTFAPLSSMGRGCSVLDTFSCGLWRSYEQGCRFAPLSSNQSLRPPCTPTTQRCSLVSRPRSVVEYIT